jgi:hypothetical protein
MTAGAGMSMVERGRVAKRLASIAALMAIGVCAVLALVFSSSLHASTVEMTSHKVASHKAKVGKGLGLKLSDVQLLKSAMASQEHESHKTCLEMCTTEKCKTACGAAKGAASKTAKKSKADLSKSDEKLLQDAQKQQKKEMVKACINHCSTDKCKSSCHAPKAVHEAHKAHRVGLGLPVSDVKLLQDAEKQQNKETARSMSARTFDLAALKKGSGNMDMSNADNVNHQPADDGDGDWSPGMRSNAMKQLGEEREEAKQTARESEETDSDDSWSH